MLSFRNFLNEHIVSIGLDPKQEHTREKHRSEIHDLLHKAYSHPSIGGYGGLKSGSKEESDSIHHDITHSIIKASKRDGKITAVNLYKNHHGRKMIAAGSDGSERGKEDWKKLSSEDHHQKRAWGEVSGAVEKIMTKIGSPKIDSKHAKKILNKDVKPVENDPHKYVRKIGHNDHEKTIMGHPKIDLH